MATYIETLPRMFDDGSAPDIFFWLGANRILTVSELLDVEWIQPLDAPVIAKMVIGANPTS